MKYPSILLAALFAVSPVFAQAQTDLKSQLQAREQKAKTDPKALLEVARWAKENSLLNEYQRLLGRVVELDPENEAARLALGHVKYKDKWMDRDKAQILEWKDKGWVQVDAVYVPKEEAEDAKRGVFHHDGQLVSKAELLQLRSGKMRHPRTGELIAKEDEAKAASGQFLIDSGRWVDAATANKHHAEIQHPWVVRTNYCTLVSTLPLEELESIKVQVDTTYEFANELFGKQPTPANRPVILLAANEEQYRSFGTQIGDGTSSYGAFLASRVPDRLSITVRPAVANWDKVKNWGGHYLRHATGLTLAHSLVESIGGEAPPWFVSGVGAYAERFQDNVGWFAQRFLGQGGLQDPKSFFSTFGITGDMEFAEIERKIYGAGLVLSYCEKGGDVEAHKALKEVAAAFDKKASAFEKAIQALEQLIGTRQDGLRDHLQKRANS